MNWCYQHNEEGLNSLIEEINVCCEEAWLESEQP